MTVSIFGAGTIAQKLHNTLAIFIRLWDIMPASMLQHLRQLTDPHQGFTPLNRYVGIVLSHDMHRRDLNSRTIDAIVLLKPWLKPREKDASVWWSLTDGQMLSKRMILILLREQTTNMPAKQEP
jgi:hypothetical protein